jgi:hypothetical protein
MSFTTRPFSMWLLLLAGFALAACETTGGPRVLVKDAQGDELRKETTLGATLPPGCTSNTTSIPAGKKSLTVSYQEPTTDHNGPPLQLLFTTVYLSSPGGQAQAIHVWTNDASGGAMVTIKNVAAPAQEFALCVTATNWARLESPPALLIPSAR